MSLSDLLLVKLGGGDVDVDAVASDLASLGRPFVLVHGAHKLRDELANDLGRPPRVVESISGFSSVFSDDDAIDVLLAAYAGIRNKRIVEALRRHGVNALGLTGLDGGVVQGEQNAGIRVKQNGRKLLLRDQSGKPKAVNVALLRSLLADGYSPVLTVPIAGADGAALNSENDEVLSLLALELGVAEVVSLMDEVGLLSDAGDPATLVDEVGVEELEDWEGRVQGRMRRKIRALRNLFEGAPLPGPTFRLSDGRVPDPVTHALAGGGTRIGGHAKRGAGGGSQAGPSSSEWLTRQAAHELDVYGKSGITLVDGSGATVRDAEGRTYLDCVGGHGALALGHRHPALERALARQAGRLWMVPGSFGNPERARFLERLHSVLPEELDRTFLSNSGTEAMEAALKVARAVTGRSGFVSAIRGFHGRTMGSLSVTSEPRFRERFEPLPGPVRRVRFNDAEGLKQAMDGEVAAVVLEPVQGEGGVYAADDAFLQVARDACDATGALLIFDEVQTGFGRTGKLFAFEHSGVVPDVLCLAKSIAGGLPLGATVVRRGVSLELGEHGSTFGGSPLACSVGRASIDVLTNEGLLQRADAIGEAICAPIREADPRVVREVRCIGAMIGIQLRVPVRPYAHALREQGVLALTAGRTVLRLLPPLVMTDEEARAVGSTLLEVLSSPPDGAGER